MSRSMGSSARISNGRKSVRFTTPPTDQSVRSCGAQAFSLPSLRSFLAFLASSTGANVSGRKRTMPVQQTKAKMRITQNIHL